jgi:predicted ester cyclase
MEGVMMTVDVRKMYARWMEMWNGAPELAEELVAPGCVVHQPPNNAIGPEGVRQMVVMEREPFEDLTFRIEVEPLIDGNHLAARWISEGRYRGGIPGATADPGTVIVFSGIDIWRVEDGKIAEYWVSSDGLHLMAQLGVGG